MKFMTYTALALPGLQKNCVFCFVFPPRYFEEQKLKNGKKHKRRENRENRILKLKPENDCYRFVRPLFMQYRNKAILSHVPFRSATQP